MDCVKCGAHVPDGGTFCSNCGARADGKKNCISCGALIDDGAVYCTYCGARTDGKKVCKNCGEVFEGNFCTKCGYGAKKDKPEKIKKEGPVGAFSRVERILTPSISLLVMAVLFICSFFIGVTAQANAALTGTGSVEVERIDVFYYFSDAFKEIESFMAAYDNNVNYTMVNNCLTCVNVICLVVVCINFVVQTVLAIVGGIKGGKDLYYKRKSSVAKYAVGMFISFIATAVIIYAANYISIYAASSGVIVKADAEMSFGSVFGIIFCAVLLLGVFVLMQVAKGKSALKANNLKFIITVVLSTVLAGITLAFFEEIGVGLNESVNTNKAKMSMGTSTFMSFILGNILETENPVIFGTASNLSIFAYFVSVVGILFTIAAFASLIISAFGGKNNKATAIAFSSVSLVLSIACTVLLSVAVKEYNLLEVLEVDLVARSTVPCIIFAVLSFASTIVYAVLNKRKQTEQTPYEQKIQE